MLLRRRSAAKNWVGAIDAEKGTTGPAGDHVLRLFDAHDRLAALQDDSDLLDDSLELAAGHRIDQALTYPDGRYHSHPVARLSPGLELRAEVDPDALPVLFRCDGQRTLRELVGADNALAPVVCAAACELLAHGLAVSVAK